MAVQQVHGSLHLGVGTLASTPVGSGLVALGRDCRDEVLDAEHLLAELFVDERGVGETQKRAIGMGLAELDEVMLAHQGFATRVDVDVDAELLALADDGVDLVVAQVELVAVLRGPAARAVQVASARGIEQDGPGNVAAVLLAHLFLYAPRYEVGLDQDGLDHVIADRGVEVHDPHHELVHVVVGIGHDLRERLALGGKQGIGANGVDLVHHLAHVVFGVCAEVVDELVGRRALCKVHWSHNSGLSSCLAERAAMPRFAFLTSLGFAATHKNGRYAGYRPIMRLCHILPTLQIPTKDNEGGPYGGHEHRQPHERIRLGLASENRRCGLYDHSPDDGTDEHS